jgi:quercetin dioxygenase-like cupin family protein
MSDMTMENRSSPMTSTKPFVVHAEAVALEAWDDPVRGVVTWRTLLSRDRTPTEALTVGVAEVRERPGDELKMHRHAQTEVYYVLSGEGVISLDGDEQALAAGSTVFIPGGLLHGARAVGSEPLRILYVFAADSFDQVHYEFPGGPA